MVPTYNEAGNIERLISEISSYHPDFDILVVDDNSPDGTGEIVDKLAKESKKIRILHCPTKRGLGNAYITGFKYVLSQGSHYDCVIEMDADFSHHPKYVERLIEAIKDKDVCIGSRYIVGGRMVDVPLKRKLLTRLANLFIRTWLRTNIKDCTGGFRCFRREVLAKVRLDSFETRGYLFQVEMVMRCLKLGYKIVEAPIVFVNRAIGDSKLGFVEVFKSFPELLRLWFKKYKS